VDINLDINLRGRELYRYRYISISIYPDSTVDIDISYPNTQVCNGQQLSASHTAHRQLDFTEKRRERSLSQSYTIPTTRI
jgi:hypothetical protein